MIRFYLWRAVLFLNDQNNGRSYNDFELLTSPKIMSSSFGFGLRVLVRLILIIFAYVCVAQRSDQFISVYPMQAERTLSGATSEFPLFSWGRGSIAMVFSFLSFVQVDC